MPRKANIENNTEEPKSTLSEYLRFGESYTSLVLGIIVVIISTILLLSFVHNKNIQNDNSQQLLSQKDIALPSTIITTITPSPTTEYAMQTKVTNTPVPTRIPTHVPTVKPTIAQKMHTTPTPTVIPTNNKMNTSQKMVKPSKSDYVVMSGDSLWTIAEKVYNSGYNWVDIARANDLSDPGLISSGQKLKLPTVEQTVAMSTQPNTVAPSTTAMTNQPVMQNNITGNTYTTVHGDTLWSIAIRAYGDGYEWPKIAQANNLTNPRLIYGGNTLIIPRT